MTRTPRTTPLDAEFRRQSPGSAPRHTPATHRVTVRLLASGDRITLRPKIAAYMVTVGTAEVDGDLDAPTQAAFDVALKANRQIQEDRHTP